MTKREIKMKKTIIQHACDCFPGLKTDSGLWMLWCDNDRYHYLFFEGNFPQQHHTVAAGFAQTQRGAMVKACMALKEKAKYIMEYSFTFGKDGSKLSGFTERLRYPYITYKPLRTAVDKFSGSVETVKTKAGYVSRWTNCAGTVTIFEGPPMNTRKAAQRALGKHVEACCQRFLERWYDFE